MKQLLYAFEFRGFETAPQSVKALMQPFASNSGPSMNALLRLTGPFIPLRDAYNFTNSPQGFTLEDASVLRNIYQGFVDNVALIGVDTLRTALTGLSFTIPGAGATGLPAVAIDAVENQVTADIRNQLVDAIIASIPGTYGRCGGMAFSAFDFFQVGWPIDRSVTSPPSTGDLRDYIWARLINSISSNGATFLEWFMILKILPVISTTASAALGGIAGSVIGGPLGAAVGALVAGKDDVLGMGGAGPLLGKTKGQLSSLATMLAGNAAWPIGLIHGNAGSLTDEHQVLATGYQVVADNIANLSYWDNVWDDDNAPKCRILRIDMTGGELNVSSADDPSCDDIKGIICESYSLTTPPVSLKLPWSDRQIVEWTTHDCL